MTAHPGNDAGVDILLIDAHGHGPTRADWPDAFLAHGLRLIRIGDDAGLLSRVARCRPALVVCDLELAHGDGYAVCAAVRSDPARRATPVLVLASSSTLSDPQRLVASGIDSFLLEPVDVQHLIGRVQLLLERPASAGAAMPADESMHLRHLAHAGLVHAAGVGAQLHQRERELGRSNSVLQALYRMTGALNRASSEPELIETALDCAIDLPGVRAVWIQIRESDASFRLAGARNLPPALLGPDAFEGPCECKRRLLEGVDAPAGGTIECVRLARATGDTGGLRYHASVPLWLGAERPLGLMNLVGPDQGLFAPEELEVLHNVGNQIAVALERVRLHGRLEHLVRERTAKLEQEIEERKRVEEQQARLVAIIDATTDMVATTGVDRVPLYCNPAGRRMLGLGADEPLSSLAPYPPRLARMMRDKALPHAIAHGSWSGEAAFVRTDGREVPVSQVIIAHKDAAGDIAFLSTISRDITEQKHNLDALRRMAQDLRAANQALEHERVHLSERVEERTATLVAVNAELAQAKQEAEQASRVKSAFLATMSHEIRTPMNGVIGMIDVLAESELTDDQRELVDTARQSGNALLGIINDILDFSKIEAEQLELDLAPVALFGLVEEVCDTVLPLAVSKGVDLSLFIAPTLPQAIVADDVRLRQILYNLLGNAIKFSADDPDRPGKVALRMTHTEDAALAIAVSDNGIGMSAETVAGLFQPFRQAEISTTRRFGGTGLGLVICKRLVDKMGGSIAVRSAPGAGSVFTVTLPVALAPEQPRQPLPDLSGVTCVVLQSPRFEAQDLSAYLVSAGARVHVLADVAQLPSAIDAVADAAPMVVISQAGVLSGAAREGLAQQRDVRHLLIGSGRRKRSRLEDGRTVAIDGAALRQRDLLQSVAVAAGRSSPEMFEHPTSTRLAVDVDPPTVDEARAQGRLILVAEDDKVNQRVIQRQLALLGYAAEIAGNGADAWRLWQDGTYGMVLSDLHMPEMDGLTLTRTIREHERDRGLRHTPIVLVSANALRGEKTRAMEAGVDDYLTKPVPLAQLKATLAQWLPPPLAAVESAPPSRAGPANAVTEATSALDVDVLRQLVGDETDVLRDFLQEYRNSARHQAGELQAAFERHDAAGARAVAHKLKTSSRCVGALALGQLCEQLEKAGRDGHWPTLQRSMAALEPAMAQVDADIEHWLAHNA